MQSAASFADSRLPLLPRRYCGQELESRVYRNECTNDIGDVFCTVTWPFLSVLIAMPS